MMVKFGVEELTSPSKISPQSVQYVSLLAYHALLARYSSELARASRSASELDSA